MEESSSGKKVPSSGCYWQISNSPTIKYAQTPDDSNQDKTLLEVLNETVGREYCAGWSWSA